MNKKGSRTPYKYDGTRVTSHQMKDMLPGVLAKLSSICQERPELVLGAWPEVIGTKLAAMTQATSFYDGVLTVKVRNSTLHSLLSCHDKNRILTALRERFPKIKIQNIVFRIG